MTDKQLKQAKSQLPQGERFDRCRRGPARVRAASAALDLAVELGHRYRALGPSMPRNCHVARGDVPRTDSSAGATVGVGRHTTIGVGWKGVERRHRPLARVPTPHAGRQVSGN